MKIHIAWNWITLGCLVFLLGADWPRFRGANNGVSSDEAPPAKFTEKENIAWKVELPAKGPASPIVVGDGVYVTCSGGANQERMYVVCYDSKTGDQRWRREFWATGRTFCHPSSGNAAPTPASDGKRIFAFFSSNDLVCLDLDGNLLWYRGLAHDYPKAGNDVGMAASPVVIGDTIIVQIENEGDSFAAGLDVATGETRWRVDRERAANWASPTHLPAGPGTKDLVLLQSGSGLTAHDPRTGEQAWKFDVACATIASAAAAPGKVYVPAGGVTALDVASNPAAPTVAWAANQIRPGPASPLLHADRLYVISNAGVLACAQITDGKILWQLRIGGTHWATPLIAGDQMYCVNQEGKLRVVKLGEKGEILGESDFGEGIQGSPAIADGALYVRSDKHLWKVAAKP